MLNWFNYGALFDDVFVNIQVMSVIELVLLFSALSCVEPSTVFALEAKPLELIVLSDEYCEYGLSRRRPNKWCICWGKIATGVEVLPWDCTTRAPVGLTRRQSRTSNPNLGNLWHDLYTKGNFFNPKPPSPESWEIPDPQGMLDLLLEKASMFMFKEIAESKSGDSLLVDELRQLLVPYMRSYIGPSYKKPSLASRVSSALKLLLAELNMMELEQYLLELKSKWPRLKKFFIAALEKLLEILREPLGNRREIVSKGDVWGIELDEPEDSQMSEKETQARSTSADEKVPSDGAGMDMWKSWASGDYSNLSKMLGTKIAASKVVDDSSQFVKAIINHALAARIAQIFGPSVVGKKELSFAGLGASPNSSDDNAIGARTITIPGGESSSKEPAGLEVSPSPSRDGMNNKFRKGYPYAPVRLDDEVLSGKTGLDREGLKLSKISDILIPRRPIQGLGDSSAALVKESTGLQQAENLGDISIFRMENSPHDVGSSSDIKRDDSESSLSDLSLGKSYLGVSPLGMSTQGGSSFDKASPGASSFGNSSLGVPTLGKSTLGDSYGKSSSTLSDSTDGYYPEKREDHVTQKQNSSGLTGQDDSALENSVTSHRPHDHTSSNFKLNNLTPTSEKLYDQTQTPTTDLLRHWE